MAMSLPIACIIAASYTYQIPAPLINAILEVEGGTVGHFSENTNGSIDMGPMQINSIWLEEVSETFEMPQDEVMIRLVYDPCFNVAVSAWILRSHIDETGNFWEGVAQYHSRTPDIGTRYVMRVSHALQTQLDAAGIDYQNLPHQTADE